MARFHVISSDSHIVEPADLWTNRIDPRFKEQAPYLRREGDADWWYVDRDLSLGSLGVLVGAGIRFDDPSKISFRGTIEGGPRGGFDPDEHIRDMDMDGVDGEVVYPSIGLRLFRIPDSALFSAICRAYNDWLAEFCSAYPARLKGIAMVNVDDVQEGVEEIKRTRKLGLAGAMISVYPQDDRQYDHPDYEPLWAAAQDLDVPLSLHIATNRPSAALGNFDPDSANQSPQGRANVDHWVRMSLSSMMFAGVFERYPNLKVGTVEHELAWIPYFLRLMDFVYRERPEQATYRFRGDTLPSDLFRRNVFLSFQEDDLGIRDRALIGVDNLMWGSDYPHAESTWPNSRQVIDHILQGVPEDEKRKIVCDNASRLYCFD